MIGSVPTGLWLGLWLRGTDIRQHGSHNIGATNTLRVLGKPMGFTALSCDIGKGLAAVILGAVISPWPYAPMVCGLTAILGHTFSLFVRFRGGKGVATSAGVFLGLCPLPVLAALAVFILVVLLSHMVSAGSCAAAVTLCATVWLISDTWLSTPMPPLPSSMVLRVVVTVVAALVVIKHHGNLRRIINGTENRLW